MDNIKNRDRLIIIDKNNKIIANIYANDENLFMFNTTPNFNKINSDIKILNSDINNNYSVNNIDFDLQHSRLGHFNNFNNIKNFCFKTYFLSQ